MTKKELKLTIENNERWIEELEINLGYQYKVIDALNKKIDEQHILIKKLNEFNLEVKFYNKTLKM